VTFFSCKVWLFRLLFGYVDGADPGSELGIFCPPVLLRDPNFRGCPQILPPTSWNEVIEIVILAPIVQGIEPGELRYVFEVHVVEASSGYGLQHIEVGLKVPEPGTAEIGGDSDAGNCLVDMGVSNEALPSQLCQLLLLELGLLRQGIDPMVHRDSTGNQNSLSGRVNE
jgi:hypothetical protein